MRIVKNHNFILATLKLEDISTYKCDETPLWLKQMCVTQRMSIASLGVISGGVFVYVIDP